MRKNDECNPLHAGGSGDKASQKKPGIELLQKLCKLVDSFRKRRVSDESETFERNKSKVGIAGVKTNLSEVLQVNILRGIKFDNDHQIQEARRFLEKCRDTVSLSCELTDFFDSVAGYKAETLTDSKEKNLKAANLLSSFLEIREQVLKMADQLKDFANDAQTSIGILEDRNFEVRLAFSYMEAILQRSAEGNEISADVADQYWDYLPLEIQEYLIADMEIEVESLEHGLPQELLDEHILETSKIHEASVSRLKNSIFRALDLGKQAPKVRITELDSRCLSETDEEPEQLLVDETDPLATPQNRGYTLEELLGKVTSENSHEATDWGKPVGNEVWW